jgi:selenium metabolism protein YedF
MIKVIDARGLACPMPVVKTKQAVDGGATELEILVDNDAAKENIRRFVESTGAIVESIVIDAGAYRMRVRRAGPRAEDAIAPSEPIGQTAGKTLFIAANTIGRGDDTLGSKLMLAFLTTLSELDARPSAVILMNSGVRLATEELQAVAHLRKLADAGAEIHVCGACLDYFGLKGKLQVGVISNMFTIAERLLGGPEVIRI